MTIPHALPGDGFDTANWTWREFVEYAAAREKVWFASREEIAAWYLQIHETHIPPSDSGKA